MALISVDTRHLSNTTIHASQEENKMRKGTFSRIVKMMLVSITVILLYGSMVFAENSLELHQTNATSSSVVAHFLNAGPNHTYNVYYRVHSENSSDEYIYLGNYYYDNPSGVLNGYIHINDLDPGTRYDVRLKVINGSTNTSYFTAPIVAVTAPSTQNLGIKQTKATETSVSFIVGGAGGITNEYKIRYYPANDEQSAITKTFYSKENEFQNEFTLEGLNPDRNYYVRITPCFRANFIDPTVTDSEQSFLAKGSYVNFEKTPLKLIPSKSVGGLYQSQIDKKSVTVSWYSKSGVDGYRVSLLDYELETSIKSGNTTNTQSSIPVNECGIYKVEVQPYVIFNGEHHLGPSSEKLTVTTSHPNHDWNEGVIQKESTLEDAGIRLFTCKYCSASKTDSIAKKVYAEKGIINSIKASKGKITLSWNKSSVAKGYFIYRKNPGSNKFTLVKKIPNSNILQWTDSKELKKGSSYSYKIKPYVVFNKKKYVSKYFSKSRSIVVK